MERLDSGSRDTNGFEGEATGLYVVVVYEDLATGLRARQTLEQTVQRLEGVTDVHVDLWRLDLFSNAGLRQRTAQDAAKADIVFFSAHGHSELPASVELWFHEWFGLRAGAPRALALSLDADAKDTPSANQMVEELGAAARQAGLELFLHLGEPKVAELETTLESVRRRAEARTIFLEELMHRSDRHAFRHYGIND